MKKIPHARILLGTALVASAMLFDSSSALAANQSWTGGNATSGSWNTATNWNGGAVPLATNTATFNAAIANTWGNSAGNPITLASDTGIGSITFGAATGSYFVGTTGGAKFLLNSGGTIQIASGSATAGAVETINAPLKIQNATGTGAGSYTISNSATSANGTLNIGGAITGNATGGNSTVLTIGGTNANSNTISGNISNGASGGTLALAKTGAGTWVLSGNNTYSGGTSIGGGGVLSVSSDSNLGTGNITLAQNGLLQATASFTTNKNFDLSSATGSATLAATAGNTLTINGALSGVSLSPTIGATGASGRVVLNGSNSFAANSIMLVKVNASLGLGNAAALNGATLKYNGGTGLDNTSGSDMTLTGLTGLELTSGFTFTGTNSLDLGITSSSFVQTAGGNRTINVVANTLTMGGILSTGTDSVGSARVDSSLIKTGAGTLVLTGTSDYTQGTTVSAGVLQGTTSSLQGAINNNATVTFKQNTTGTYSGSMNGTGTVVVNSTGGKVIFSGTNSYTGNTTVTAGTLVINGDSSTATGDVNVASGATLGGNGTIGGALNVSGSLAPGNSPGNLTVNNNVTITSGGTLSMELNGATSGSGYDRVTMTGGSSTFSLTGTNNLELSLGYSPAVNALFFLVDNQGSNAISGIFEQLNGVTTTLTQGSLFTVGGIQFQISYTGDVTGNTFTGGNDLVLQVAAIPEPATWALLACGLTVTMVLRRRRVEK